MDPALLREHQDYLKKAKALSTIGKVVKNNDELSDRDRDSRRIPASNSSSSDFRFLEIKPQQQGRFALLSRIVKYMKQRHLERDLHPLSVEEILEESMLHDMPPATAKWLEEEALPNNPKILVTSDKKFVFKPRFDIRSRQDLYQLLKSYEYKGLGGISIDDLSESIPDIEKVLSSFGDHIVRIVTPHDKKTVIFYNDKSFDLNIDEEFKQHWRAVSVEGVHETKIEDYLKRNGISSMSGERRHFMPIQRKKTGQKRTVARPVKIKDNEHVNSILEDFSKKTPKLM